MGRYIDADKVKEYILSTGFYCDTEADRKHSAELIDELFPTADVVEVVRCEECDNWDPMTHGCVRNPCVKPWWESDYCSYWEKRDE